MADPALAACSGRAIGQGMALCLAEKGCEIILRCRADKNAAEEVKSATGDLGRPAGILRFDGFFTSKEASYITREITSVNGGLF